MMEVKESVSFEWRTLGATVEVEGVSFDGFEVPKGCALWADKLSFGKGRTVLDKEMAAIRENDQRGGEQLSAE